MKKKILIRHILALALAVTLTLLSFARLRAQAVLATTDSPAISLSDNQGILRLHVLANSDATEDQAVKLLVRDALLPLFAEAESYESARAFLLAHGKEMQALCEKTLRENGFLYGVQLELGVSDFPDRSYGTTFYPAGEYDALRLLLGEASGQNWWCVLFPPLCIISDATAEDIDLDNIAFESDIWNWLKELFSKDKTMSEVN